MIDKFRKHRYHPPRKIVYLYNLLTQLVIRELKLLYKRSFLGLAWTLINPLLQLLVFSIVFRSVLTLDIEHYTSFIFIGLLVWNWFQNSLVQATGVIVHNPYLIRQPNFPVAILPIVVVLTGMIHFLLALPVLLGFLWMDGVQFKPIIVEVFILMFIQLVLTTSLSYVLAALNVMFRDTQHTVEILLKLGFYLTPIFYNISHVPTAYQGFYILNPIAHLVTAYRNIIIDGKQPDWLTLLCMTVLVIAILTVSQKFFRRQSDRFIEEI